MKSLFCGVEISWSNVVRAPFESVSLWIWLENFRFQSAAAAAAAIILILNAEGREEKQEISMRGDIQFLRCTDRE